jgi:hypothetical protein
MPGNFCRKGLGAYGQDFDHILKLLVFLDNTTLARSSQGDR